MRPTTLYHFTNHLNWHFIKTAGIDRGEAPTSLTTVLNHPNLTADANPGSQGWAGPGLLGILRKTTVRIAVQVPPGDDRLISWRDFATLHKMPRRDYRVLDTVGNFGAKNWWIYRGTIPPEWFTDIELFGDDAPADDYQRRLMRVAELSSSIDDLHRRIGARRFDGGMIGYPSEIPDQALVAGGV